MNEYNNFPHILSLIITTNIWWNIFGWVESSAQVEQFLGGHKDLDTPFGHTHKKKKVEEKKNWFSNDYSMSTLLCVWLNGVSKFLCPPKNYSVQVFIWGKIGKTNQLWLENTKLI